MSLARRSRMSQVSVKSEFVQLLNSAEPRVFAYVHAHIPGRHDAEDVFQQTVVVLWAKFDQFKSGTDFIAWALKVASFEIRTFYRKQQQEERLFSEAFLNLVSETAERMSSGLEDLKNALAGCLEKLNPDDCDVVHRYYDTDATVKSVAAEMGCPIETIRTVLKRSRRNLYWSIALELTHDSGRW